MGLFNMSITPGCLELLTRKRFWPGWELNKDIHKRHYFAVTTNVTWRKWWCWSGSHRSCCDRCRCLWPYFCGRRTRCGIGRWSRRGRRNACQNIWIWKLQAAAISRLTHITGFGTYLRSYTPFWKTQVGDELWSEIEPMAIPNGRLALELRCLDQEFRGGVILTKISADPTRFWTNKTCLCATLADRFRGNIVLALQPSTFLTGSITDIKITPRSIVAWICWVACKVTIFQPGPNQICFVNRTNGRGCRLYMPANITCLRTHSRGFTPRNAQCFKEMRSKGQPKTVASGSIGVSEDFVGILAVIPTKTTCFWAYNSGFLTRSTEFGVHLGTPL